MKNIIMIVLFILPFHVNANPTLDYYFYGKQKGQPNYKVLSVDQFLEKLTKQCSVLDQGDALNRVCYSNIVNELSSLLKDTLKAKLDEAKANNGDVKIGKKQIDNSVKVLIKEQHLFDQYYDFACSLDKFFPNGGLGSNAGGMVDVCRMQLLIERTKFLLDYSLPD